MGTYPTALRERLRAYAEIEGVMILARLGFGMDGSVHATDRQSAVKVFERRESYQTERAVYLRLRRDRVQSIQGHAVPQLLAFDDPRGAIEMTIVKPPYLLDFAKAQLDVPPNFPPQVMADWRREKAEQFGEHWTKALSIMRMLERRHGIYLLDVNLRNFAFA